jgi:hypothetical protein
MLSAVLASGGARLGTALGAVARSARLARWLRPCARPPRAPRRRRCSGDVLKVKKWSVMVSIADTTFITSGGGHTQAENRIRRLRREGDAGVAV